jgi:hypothetical protein
LGHIFIYIAARVDQRGVLLNDIHSIVDNDGYLNDPVDGGTAPGGFYIYDGIHGWQT